MLQVAIVAFTTFFATVGPLDLAALFAALTPDSTPTQRRAMAIKGTVTATAILVAFALFGTALLDHLGISLAALRAAGGILLLLLSIDMVFGEGAETSRSTKEETIEAQHKHDISVFPLAMPLIAGPATIGAVVLLTAQAQGDPLHLAVVIAALLAVLALTLLSLLSANHVQRLLGVTGLHVVSRTVGVLLAALAVQFIFEGVAQSGMFT